MLWRARARARASSFPLALAPRGCAPRPRVRKSRDARRAEEGTCIAVIYKFEGRRLTLPDVDRQACHRAVLLRLCCPRPTEKRGSNWVRSTFAFSERFAGAAADKLQRRIKPPRLSRSATLLSLLSSDNATVIIHWESRRIRNFPRDRLRVSRSPD